MSPSVAKARVLEALRTICSDGWPATVREVQTSVGLASPATAHNHLVDLERDGLAERHPRGQGWRPKGTRQ